MPLLIGQSAGIAHVRTVIEAAAPSAATVLITGESGVGKDLVAQSIHLTSPRRDALFLAVNCGAIPRDLIESELFGHVKGSFTGALADRLGAVERADGGTLFLDEICELAVDLQPKLLRFLQSGEFAPVGSSQQRTGNVRIICATNRDPPTEIARGRLREDLFYRLNVLPILVPPLRERGGDILIIARNLVARYAQEEGKVPCRLSAGAEQAILRYRWPGNVRQLQNVIRNAVVMSAGGEITRRQLALPETEPARRTSNGEGPPTTPAACIADPTRWAQPSDIRPLADLERIAVERAIAVCEGNLPRAAALLGVSTSTIYRKRQAWAGCGH